MERHFLKVFTQLAVGITKQLGFLPIKVLTQGVAIVVFLALSRFQRFIKLFETEI